MTHLVNPDDKKWLCGWVYSIILKKINKK
ncbi:hypothetical protein DESC_770182 [Desulfosarcina cetonica]|nr:hypothetical protein DESC_770182 [Desulfosarcina cetonica]